MRIRLVVAAVVIGFIVVIGFVGTSCSAEPQSEAPSTEAPRITSVTTGRAESSTETFATVDVPLLRGTRWVQLHNGGLLDDRGRTILLMDTARRAGTRIERSTDGTVFVLADGAVVAIAAGATEPVTVLDRDVYELARLPDGTVIAYTEDGTIDLLTGEAIDAGPAEPNEKIFAANGLSAERTEGVFETSGVGAITRVIRPDGVRLLDEWGEQNSRWELGGPLDSRVSLVDFDGRFLLAARGPHDPDPTTDPEPDPEPDQWQHFLIDVLGGTFEYFDAVPGSVALATADDPELPNVRRVGGVDSCPTWSSTPPKLAPADLAEPVSHAFDEVMLGVIRCDSRFMKAVGAPIEWTNIRAWRALMESLIGAARVEGETTVWNTALGTSVAIDANGSIAIAVDPDPSFELKIMRDDSYLTVWGSAGPEGISGIQAAATSAADRLGLTYYDWGLSPDGPELDELTRQGIEEFIGTTIGGAEDITAVDAYLTDEILRIWAHADRSRSGVLGELSRPQIEQAGIAIVEWIDRRDVTDEEAAVFERLQRFAAGGRLDEINWAPEVVLAAGPIPAVILTPDQLADPANWNFDVGFFRAGDGRVSALSMLTRGRWAEPIVGPHPHCASGPMAAPAALSGLRRVSIQRTDIDSCLAWGTVDVFVDPDGRIAGVSLDYWEP